MFDRGGYKEKRQPLKLDWGSHSFREMIEWFMQYPWHSSSQTEGEREECMMERVRYRGKQENVFVHMGDSGSQLVQDGRLSSII